MVANTGTYLDAPFHRYADGKDLARARARIARRSCPGWSSAGRCETGIAIDADAFDGLDVAGKAVLVHTGWDRHWRTDAYFGDHPFLTADAADWLVEQRRRAGRDRQPQYRRHACPRAAGAHRLLGAGIPICEHMTGLGSLPDSGFRFSAVPPKVNGMGTFPVRAYAVIAA